jgi:hypothetical protein
MNDKPGEQSEFSDPDQQVCTHEISGPVEVLFTIGEQYIQIHIGMH